MNTGTSNSGCWRHQLGIRRTMGVVSRMCLAYMYSLTIYSRRARRFKTVLVILVFMFCAVKIWKGSKAGIDRPDFASGSKNDNNTSKSRGYDRDQACQFPILDPFDKSILAFVTHQEPLICQKIQPDFTYTDGFYMKVNLPLASGKRFRDVSYRKITRKSETENTYGPWTVWNISQNPSVYLTDSVEVQGFYDNQSEYTMIHCSVHVNVTLENRNIDLGTIPMNVLIFAIDSMSRSNVVRSLPMTYALLTERIKSTVFQGYNKIDDNTFPNIVAVLTGRKVGIHGSELSGHFQNDHVDHYPFIWKNFSSAGYITGLAEEQDGTMSFLAKGFNNSPVDWYLRPFGLAMEENKLKKNSSIDCFANQPDVKVILDSIERFIIIRRESGTPYFLFSLIWKLSHDSINDVQKLDHMIFESFNRLFEGGYLNDTVLFVMGDHGNRFDAIRETLIGRYEERMPYLSIYVPPSFQANFPSQMKTLNENAWRLTCQYDVYETLVDILNQNYGDTTRPRLKNRGHSLFSQVPKSRTCSDAQIGEHFCVCQEEEELNVENSTVVESAVNYTINKINSELLSKYQHFCETVRLEKVVSAQKYKASNNVKFAVRYDWNTLISENNVASVISNLRVTFTTSPGNGLFEALVQYYETDTDSIFDPIGVEISRINKYGHDADCIKAVDKVVGKFCYCKK